MDASIGICAGGGHPTNGGCVAQNVTLCTVPGSSTLRALMVSPAFRFRIVRLLAALMLLTALLPGVSRAWAVAQGGDWIEICSAQGSRWVQVDGQDGSGIQPMTDPCAACLLQQQVMAPPPQPLDWAPLPVMQDAPALFYLAPRPLAVWQSRLSRGPPASV